MLIIMPFCAVAFGKGHRCEEEEDLGHVWPPNCAGGKTDHSSHTSFLTVVIWFLLVLLCTSRSCISGGCGTSLQHLPVLLLPVSHWKKSCRLLPFQLIHYSQTFLGGKNGKALQGFCTLFYWGQWRICPIGEISLWLSCCFFYLPDISVS